MSKHPFELPTLPVKPELRRSFREQPPSTRYPLHKYVMLIDKGKPKCFEEVMSHQHKSEEVKAMQDEMKSMNENHTYDFVKSPKEERALKNKWIYIWKTRNNSQQRYKAKLVMKGFG